ncbi:indole-3-glycerol phosphate synthase TrpC [Edaphobacter dinghuensis]|uniref:Indole-3-glycerol phosphate synthase n=1 Tax=Edaphobacter dinghuensis TaxID=1560005 RepID=A0A917M011_9BACT|nr:indole-3-glycerol phosphate synthase TrpC [Edaphobacter dinghuensis]GGG68953.1 indole-3-glycerol phosphate synthase [Edaphobacter dinghuensis]
MATKLDEILADTRAKVDARKTTADYAALERRAAAHMPRGFAAGLRAAAAKRPAIISEIKKASPSKGLIRGDFHPESLARMFETAGAAALSVLTNEAFFQGSLEYLEVASVAVKIPCLRKDFMVDRFQLLEARASGADAILLIVAALTDPMLTELRDEAARMGLDVLCEVHDRQELERAVQLGFKLIGVNSRDLRTFTVSPELVIELAQWKPADTLMVAESGIGSAADIARYSAAGYEAFLVGEALMRQPDPGAALAALLACECPAEI